MENQALTSITILSGLLLPYKPLKLKCNDGNKLSDRRNETTAQLLRDIPTPDSAYTGFSGLILAVVPIVDGLNSGSIQVVTPNDGKGISHKQVIRTVDGKRFTIMKLMK